MRFLDKFKKQAQDLAEDHGDKIENGIDKVAEIADDKTGGKYSDQIDSGADKAKDVVDGLGGDNE